MRPIAVLMMAGRGVTLRLDDGTFTTDQLDPSDAIVTLSVKSNGTLQIIADNGDTYAWVTGASPANYEVRATATSGSQSSGTMGVWLPLTSTRSWTVERTSVGTKTAIFTVEIGLAGTSTALESASITMSATVAL